MVLTAKNLNIAINGRSILTDVSCEIRAGEVTGLIGANGSGKSTLVRALARLITPQSGTVSLDGKDVKSLPARALAKQIAYLPQERIVHWPLAVHRIAALGRIPHLMPWEEPGPRDQQAVACALEKTDALRFRDRRFSELAGGEKALVLLARALAVEPRLLLADEPVAGLDPHHELQVMQVLHALAREGCAVLVVLHHLTLAARFCDRLLLLNRGKIHAAGKPEEVLTPASLKACFGIEAVFGKQGPEFFVLPWSRTNPDERPVS